MLFDEPKKTKYEPKWAFVARRWVTDVWIKILTGFWPRVRRSNLLLKEMEEMHTIATASVRAPKYDAHIEDVDQWAKELKAELDSEIAKNARILEIHKEINEIRKAIKEIDEVAKI